MMIATGYFVDWNGDTRSCATPGEGFECRLSGRPHPSIDVIDTGGFVVHEATHFPTLEAVVNAGVAVNLIGTTKSN